MPVNTIFHKIYASIKQFLPSGFTKPIRSFFTAIVTPWRYSLRKGHFRSSFANKALDNSGQPIPWYTYPVIDFLKYRNYDGKRVLEFGGGQSTLWWAMRCKSVISFEGSKNWFDQIKKSMPENVELNYVEQSPQDQCLKKIKEIINNQKFDIIIVDGLWRFDLAVMAKEYIKPDGAIIVDNSSGYKIYEAFLGSEFNRIDFYGLAPGVILEACTSVFFNSTQCFLLDNQYKIFDIEKSY